MAKKEKVSFKEAVERKKFKHINRYMDFCGKDPYQSANICKTLGTMWLDKANDRKFIGSIMILVSKIITTRVSSKWFVRLCQACDPNDLEAISNIAITLFQVEVGDFDHSISVVRLLVEAYKTNRLEIAARETINQTLISIIYFFGLSVSADQLKRNFFSCIIDKNPEAVEIFERFIVTSATLFSGHISLARESASWSPNFPTSHKEGENIFVVPDQYFTEVERFVLDFTNREKAQTKETSKFLDWFNQNLDFFEGLRQEYWEDIKTNPKRLLRDNGKDCIKINIKQLNNPALELETIQFFREGCVFPGCMIRVWGKRKNHLTAFDFRIDGRSLNQYIDKNDFIPPDHVNNILGRLLGFLGTYCYWVITCEKHGGHKKIGPKEKGIEDKSRYEVRTHLRILPEGYQASEEAREKAKELLNIDLPLGITIVGSHWRNLQTEYDEMKEFPPLFTIDEKDILYERV